MKVGDIVKRKWITFAQKRRALQHGRIVDEIGIVVDLDFINTDWCLVWFASREDIGFKHCKKKNLETVNA